jgi:hypothetical protein
LDTESYDLAYDRATNSLWLATMRSDGSDFLYRVNAETQESQRWQLPDTDHNGFLTEVEVADDGVWLTYEYLLIRFDPETQTMASQKFPIVQPEANRYGGTWISGLGPAGNAVWVARNGLPELVLMDPAMHEAERLELPAEFVGPEDVAAVGRDVYVLGPSRDDGQGNVTQGGVGIFSGDGQLKGFGAIESARLQVSDGRVLARGGDSRGGETAWISSDGRVDRLEPGSYDILGIPASAEAVITYYIPPGDAPGLIERHQGGVATILVSFPRHVIHPGFCGPPMMPIASGSSSAEPTCPPMWVGAPNITGMAIDAAGALWYLENAQEGSILSRLPAGS